MTSFSSQLVGRDREILVIALPEAVTDEQEMQIRDEVRARLPRRNDAGLVLDFSAVGLINSIGITCLLKIEEDTRKSGTRMVFANVPAPIAQFFRQLKLDRKFTVHPSVDDAVAAVTVR
ncbi:MAG: STAS domain-containing protein [Phycisphaerales bacterium]